MLEQQTDAFFGMRYFVNPSVKYIPQMSKLAYALMHNEHLPQSPPRSPSSVGAGSSRSDSPGCGDCSGQLTRLNLFSGYSGCGQTYVDATQCGEWQGDNDCISIQRRARCQRHLCL